MELVVVAEEERVPKFVHSGDRLPGKDKVNDGDEVGEVFKEFVSAIETVLEPDEVTLNRGDFEAEGEEDMVTVSIELPFPLKDLSPLVLAFPEAVG